MIKCIYTKLRDTCLCIDEEPSISSRLRRHEETWLLQLNGYLLHLEMSFGMSGQVT